MTQKTNSSTILNRAVKHRSKDQISEPSKELLTNFSWKPLPHGKGVTQNLQPPVLKN
ncbi:MAG: hypothetical protein JWP81_1638 [Ferruginibacter sp.]|nr:hypothetical protein [Ferruginibacter sp.]